MYMNFLIYYSDRLLFFDGLNSFLVSLNDDPRPNDDLGLNDDNSDEEDFLNNFLRMFLSV